MNDCRFAESDSFGETRDRTVIAEEHSPRVIANEEVRPERDHDEDEHDVSHRGAAGRDEVRERIREHEADDRGDGGQRERAKEDVAHDRLAELLVGLDVPARQVGAAGSGAGRERVDDDDAERDGEEQNEVEVRGQGEQESAAALVGLVRAGELGRHRRPGPGVAVCRPGLGHRHVLWPSSGTTQSLRRSHQMATSAPGSYRTDVGVAAVRTSSGIQSTFTV